MELKQIISSYISRYPAPNKNSNKINLEKLDKLRSLKKTKETHDKYKKIRDEIVLSNGGFGMKYVMRYHRALNNDTSITELFQEAIIGLMESVDTFDITKKTTFTTYAHFHVKKRLIDFIKHNKLVRAPRDIARNMKHVHDAQEILYSKSGNDPTSIELNAYLKKEKDIHLKEDIIESIMILLNLNSCGCDDTFMSEYVDQLSFEEEESIFKKMHTNIEIAMKETENKIKEALRLRFGLGRDYPHTPEEIKLIMGKIKYNDL